MNSKRIEEIQEQTAYPESMSVRQALMQVWNELQQDFNSRTCENCRFKNERALKNYAGSCGLHRFMIPLINGFGCTKGWESK